MRVGIPSKAVWLLLLMITLAWSGPNASYADYDCDNQNLIDACVVGCSLTEGACKGLCGAAIDTCKGTCTAASGVCSGVCGAAESTCKGGCTAASAVCDWACGAAIDTCKGAVYTGCNIAFGACKSTVCGDDYDDCIDDGYDDCEGDCDGCVLDCKTGCETKCDSCQLDCETGCDADCDACRLPCEEDCQFPCRQVGEECVPVDPGFGEKCANGLTCFATLGLLNDNAYTCFPSDTDELIPDETCRSFWVEDLQQAAIDLGNAMNFGANATAGVGITTSTEVGVVYGPDGRFGCYFTNCTGGVTDVGAAIAGCAGLYTSYDSFKGIAEVTVEAAGKDPASFSTAQVWNLPEGELIGTADCFAIAAGIAPVSGGYLSCSTIVDTVSEYDPDTGEVTEVLNNPPVALCADQTVCADAISCSAAASIDNGSYDPDSDVLLTDEEPPSPYTVGEHLVTLTVDDQHGETDTCNGDVTVADCTRPEITCPDSIKAECQNNSQAVVDPGNAAATDSCSPVTVNDPGAASYPLGDTIVTYTATDSWGNASSCDMTVSVVDTTKPEISCPDSIAAECESNRQAVVDPGDATATDSCSPVTVNDPGAASYPLGDTIVTYTATDSSGNARSCDMTVSVVDTTKPEISCNATDIAPPDAPVTFTATATDECDDVSVEITAYACHRVNGKGKIIDLTDNCDVEIDGAAINIMESGGIGNNISWRVTATDPSGNTNIKTCEIEVKNPGHRRH